MTEGRHRVTALPDGTFRVVTTLERILSQEQMAEEGIPLPALDLPWSEEKAGPPPERLRKVQDPNAPLSPYRVARDYWKEHLGGWDYRFPDMLRGALREFGLQRVLQAFDEVKAQGNVNVPKYVRLKKLLNAMREGGK